MEEFVIRKATKSERPLLAELTLTVYSEYVGEYDPTFWNNYQQSIRTTVLEGDDLLRLVALRNNTIAGSVILCPSYEKMMGDKLLRNPYWEMPLLAVLPEFRKEGVGARLITACENQIAAFGQDVITLHTTTIMKTAAAMYQRRGYDRYPEIDFEPVPGFVVYGYRKQLAPSLVAADGDQVLQKSKRMG
jgi:ribosomal protein S18 acetylase RimI-like enzyme